MCLAIHFTVLLANQVFLEKSIMKSLEIIDQCWVLVFILNTSVFSELLMNLFNTMFLLPEDIVVDRTTFQNSQSQQIYHVELKDIFGCMSVTTVKSTHRLHNSWILGSHIIIGYPRVVFIGCPKISDNSFHNAISVCIDYKFLNKPFSDIIVLSLSACWFN